MIDFFAFFLMLTGAACWVLIGAAIVYIWMSSDD
jgi:hypothetical protein